MIIVFWVGVAVQKAKPTKDDILFSLTWDILFSLTWPSLTFLLMSYLFRFPINLPCGLGEPSFAKHLMFAILSVVLVDLLLFACNFMGSLQTRRNLCANLAAECTYLVFIWALFLLIKSPRFFYVCTTSSCESSHDCGGGGGLYMLVSVGAFALSALLLSEGHDGENLGLFVIFVELIMDASLEITTAENGPTLGYVLGSFLYCFALIILKHVSEERIPGACRKNLVFLSTLVGMVCFFLSPFSAAQFKDSVNAKAVCFIVFTFVLSRFLGNAREYIAHVSLKCREQFAVKVTVEIALFAVVSLFIFATKYPRFQIHSKNKESLVYLPYLESWLRANAFAIFSLFALMLSTFKEQPVTDGCFSFLVGLIMDAFMESLGNENWRLFKVFHLVFCIILIIGKCYINHDLAARTLIKRLEQGPYATENGMAILA